MKNGLWLAWTGKILLAGALCVGCQAEEFPNMTWKEEIQEGEKFWAETRADHQKKFMHAPAAIQKIFEHITARYTPAKDFPGKYHLWIERNPDMHAHSCANGVIILTSGAVISASNEAEIAGVMAHEISHILQHSLREKIKVHAALAKKASDSLVSITDFIAHYDALQERERKADLGALAALRALGYHTRSFQEWGERAYMNDPRLAALRENSAQDPDGVLFNATSQEEFSAAQRQLNSNRIRRTLSRAIRVLFRRRR